MLWPNQGKEADLDLDRILIAQLDANALGQVLFAQEVDDVARQSGIQAADAGVSEVASAAIDATTSSEIRMEPWSLSVDQYSL